MCFSSSPSTPDIAPPPPPPEPQPSPKRVDQSVQTARSDATRRARAAAGTASMIRTSARGLQTEPTTRQKQLLGA